MSEWTVKDVLEHAEALKSPFERPAPGAERIAPSLDVLKRRAVLKGIRPRLPKGMHWMPGSKTPMKDSEMRGMMVQQGSPQVGKPYKKEA